MIADPDVKSGASAHPKYMPCFWKLMVAVGLCNVFVMGLLISALRPFVPAAILIAENQDKLRGSLNFLSSINDMSTATVRLLHGSMADLVNDLVTSDISTAASDTKDLASSVHQAVCEVSPDKNAFDPDGEAGLTLWGISKYSDLTRSIMQQVMNLPNLNSDGSNIQAPSGLRRAAVDMEDDSLQLTGEGGLLLDIFKSITSYIEVQTDPAQWGEAACGVAKLSMSMSRYITWEGTYGPECGGTDNLGSTMKWDVSESASYYLQYIYDTASPLCTWLAEPKNNEAVVE